MTAPTLPALLIASGPGFHHRIMNLQCDVDGVVADDARLSFKLGHKQARHRSAELALQADGEIERLKAVIAYLMGEKPLHALGALYRVLAPAEGDYNDDEIEAMDLAREVLIAGGEKL